MSESKTATLKKAYSLPVKHDPLETIFASQGDPQIFYRSTVGQITSEEDEALRAKFEADLLEILSNLTEELTEGQILEIYFLLGRFNPPHEGHFEAMFQMIDRARASGNPKKIIIFAGSGPKNNEKTSPNTIALNILNNPIPFGEKKVIIADILALRYGREYVEQNIEIIEMGFVPSQLSNIIGESMKYKKKQITIKTIRVAGKKDDDVEKSLYVGEYIKKFAEQNSFIYIDETLPIEPVISGSKSASATRVRLDALRMEREDFITTYLASYEGLIIRNNNLGLSDLEIKESLRGIIGKIWDDIHRRIETEKITINTKGKANLTDSNVYAYINSGGDTAAPLKRKEEKAGGSKRRKTKNRRLTKRRKTKRRKLTKRRKSKRRRH